MQAETMAAKLVSQLAREPLSRVIELLETGNWPSSRDRILSLPGTPRTRMLLKGFLDGTIAQYGPQAAAMALRCARATSEHYREQQQIEPVWTGPPGKELATRHTAQALIQLINTANQSLLIVSFAVYNIHLFTKPLENALKRGVAITFIPDHAWKEGHGALSQLAALKGSEHNAIQFYHWPEKARIEDQTKSAYASLHAKCAVGDNRQLFLGSANLTQRAMERNMELGLLITGGKTPPRIAAHFNSLIREKVFLPLKLSML